MTNAKNKVLTKAGNDLWDTVRAANKGDATALADLRRELVGDNAKTLIAKAGDLANQAELSTVNAMLGDQEGSKIIVLRKLETMRAELGWDSSPKLEQVLIERVVQTWLSLHLIESGDAQAGSRTRTIPVAKYDAARVEQAERRHLRAVKMLATVRKMALPTLIAVKADIQVTENRTNSQPPEKRSTVPANSI